MYDVIVVGARCGGAPTAMLLARKGYNVLLVDRATFPSEIPHGHFIHRQGPRLLHRWGLLDRIVATGCSPVSTATFDFGDFPLVGTDLVVDGVALGYAPRRLSLDKILVDAAVEAGAELREGFVVEEFDTDGDRITGIRGRERRGRSLVTERAQVTVGADGRHSRLAQTVQAPAYEAAPTVCCWYFSYWSGVPATGLEIYVRPNRAIFASPTNDGQHLIFIAWPAAELPTVRADIEREFMQVVAQVPEFTERVRSGRREERFYGATDLPNFLRKPFGPGWALVGDAGCHKDPFLALGICDAFRDAELLVEALDDGLSGRSSLDAALAGYERRRNEATLPEYHENLHMAQFKPLPPDAYQLRAALRGNQEATNQFYLARQGMIPYETFFNPENLQRILSAGAS
jgi:2-polyprenyl-6-methoxyphenol hydroxylase-like FAD-dependent oxidoreductase